MYTSAEVVVGERLFPPGVAEAHAPRQIRPKQSVLCRLFAWAWPESMGCRDLVWQRVARLQISGSPGVKVVNLNARGCYRFVRLKPVSVDVRVLRLTLEFSDDSLQDLSMGSLLQGSESRPMSIECGQLRGIVMQYEVRTGAHGRVEVWAHN